MLPMSLHPRGGAERVEARACGHERRCAGAYFVVYKLQAAPCATHKGGTQQRTEGKIQWWGGHLHFKRIFGPKKANAQSLNLSLPLKGDLGFWMERWEKTWWEKSQWFQFPSWLCNTSCNILHAKNKGMTSKLTLNKTASIQSVIVSDQWKPVWVHS